MRSVSAAERRGATRAVWRRCERAEFRGFEWTRRAAAKGSARQARGDVSDAISSARLYVEVTAWTWAHAARHNYQTQPFFEGSALQHGAPIVPNAYLTLLSCLLLFADTTGKVATPVWRALLVRAYTPTHTLRMCPRCLSRVATRRATQPRRHRVCAAMSVHEQAVASKQSSVSVTRQCHRRNQIAGCVRYILYITRQQGTDWFRPLRQSHNARFRLPTWRFAAALRCRYRRAAASPLPTCTASQWTLRCKARRAHSERRAVLFRTLV